MISLGSLWLPIVLSAVFVFVASAIIHMTKLWHKNDYPRVPNEDGVRNALRPFAIPPGEYLVPRAYSGKEMRTPEYQAKVKEGPVLVLTVLPNREFSMSRNLLLWFVYTLIVSWFAAYIASRTLPPGTDYLKVFQIAGATAFIGYAVALLQMSIWYQRSWRLTVKAVFDGLIYALLTAGTFGWLWPQG
jgi:hypothetical protein